MFLGIDLGTTDLKLLLLDDAHRVHAVVNAALTVQRPQRLWSEQDPAQWWQALDGAMTQLTREHGEAVGRVKAVGLAGQMHGAVLLDDAGSVLRPAILWNDGRSQVQCKALTQALPALGTLAGNLAMPGFTAPKLMWVREHEPDVFARVARVLLPKDWLRWRLTGEAVSDMSDASGTLWLDVGARAWSDELLRASGMQRAQMPSLVEGSAAAAHLHPDLAARWGLGANRGRDAAIVVAGGAGDNAASAVGMGLVEPGQGFVSLGTSGVVFVTTDRFLPNPARAMHAFCHAVPDRWHQMSVMLSAASAVQWAVRLCRFDSVPALLAAAATLTPQAHERAPIFLPYLSGERTPHNDPGASGALLGLGHDHDAADVAWAVVEGVSFGLRDGFDTLSGHETASPANGLALVGGGARSDWWGQLLADVLQVPLTRYAAGAAGAALGAARLGWMADGGVAANVYELPATDRTWQPSNTESESMAVRLAGFRKAYRDIRGASLTAPLHGHR